jgi:predicted phosphoribosyltransferase
MSPRALFVDRADAGRRLARKLTELALERPAVYALPRGGVPVAAAVAAALNAPLDLVLVRKIGAPGQPELAVGAVVDGDLPEVVINDSIAAAAGADAEYIASAKAQALREIERRRAVYLKRRERINPQGCDAIVVDDGVATGATTLAAVHALKRRGAQRVIVATPVAPPDAVARLEADADQVICLAQPEWFPGISAFYDDFHQLEDDEVVQLLDQAARPSPDRTPPAEGARP